MSETERPEGSVAPSTIATSPSRRFSEGAEPADAPPIGRIPWGLVAGAPIALIGLVFTPLALALLEGMLFKSRRVEEFFEYVGLHEALSTIYTPVAMWFFSLTGMRP